MAITLSWNGSNYLIPEPGEVGWGSNLDDFFVALPAGALQKIGGSFTLASEVDFGGAFGLKSLYYKSRGTNPSSTGIFRMENAATGIGWRNAANNADLLLTVNASNDLTFNGAVLATSALSNGHIFVGNVSNVATDVAMSGDITITNAGVTAIGAGKIVNAQVNAAAAIAYSKLALTNSIVNADIASAAAIAVSKLAALTVSRAVVTDGSGFISAATTTATEIGYVNGVTSAIQTQLNAKEPTITTLPVSKGGTGDNSLTAYAVLAGGTTSTGAVQSVSGLGASGQILTSNGAGALPTWANATGSGTVNSGVAGRLSLYPTSTTTVGDTYVQNSQNIVLLIATQASRSTGLTLTIPNPGNAVAAASFALTEGAQTINGANTFTSAVTIPDGVAVTTAASVGQVNKAFQNILINGGMDFWQRATSSGSNPADNTYNAVDRWCSRKSGTFTGGGYSYSQQTSPLDGSGTYMVRINNTNTGGTNPRYFIQQKVENFADYAGKTVTLTVRLSTAGVNVAVQMDDGVTTTTTAAAGTASYETVTVTKTISASATQLFINIGWPSANADANTTINIASAMLVLGSVAVPYVAPNYATELARCQRYYEKSFAIATAPATGVSANIVELCGAQGGANTVYTAFIAYKATKRTTPTVTLYGSSSTGQWQWTDLTGSGTQRATSVSTGSINGFNVVQTVALNYVASGHFTADAEI